VLNGTAQKTKETEDGGRFFGSLQVKHGHFHLVTWSYMWIMIIAASKPKGYGAISLQFLQCAG